jgi:hypothetical protein
MTADEIMGEIESAAGRGLEAAAHFLLERTEEKLSVPAPYRLNRRGRRVATVPATPGAPPRMLSGVLRGSGHVEAVSETEQQVVYGTPYAPTLEFDTGHPFAIPTLEENLDALGKIIGEEFTAGVNQ